MVQRQVYCTDALKWLEQNRNHKVIITSLPDMEEVGLNLNDWQNWIFQACQLLELSLADDGIIFFYQTDRRYKGQIVDKKGLIGKSASKRFSVQKNIIWIILSNWN